MHAACFWILDDIGVGKIGKATRSDPTLEDDRRVGAGGNTILVIKFSHLATLVLGLI